MDTLVNANIAYLLLMLGSIFVFLALLTPGTHFLEVGALFLLFLAGYEIFRLGFNWWALVILVLSLVPFIYSIRRPGREWALALSLAALIVGSLYMFPGEGLAPEVNPVLAIVVSILTAGFMWIVVRKGISAIRSRPLQDTDRLIGMVGEARTEVGGTGAVQVASELWSARSEERIPAGSQVKVVARDGFTLVVESLGQLK